MGHSISDQQEIVRTPGFNETWCFSSAYGAYQPCKLLAPYTTPIYGHKYFKYFMKIALSWVTKATVAHYCLIKISVVKDC